MNAKKEYLELARWAVDEARKAGADGAEAIIADSESLEVSVSAKAVEQFNAVRDAGIGLRFLKDQKMAFGSSNDLAKPAIKDMIAGLAKKVPYHTPDEFNVLAGAEDGAKAGEWAAEAEAVAYDPKVAETPVEEKVKRALRVEAAGLESSPKIKGAMGAGYQDGTTFIYLANSNGVAGWFPASGCGGGAEFSAAEGEDQQSGSHFRSVVRFADFDPDAVGKRAAGNAVRMLGAKPIPSCEIPLVVSPEVGSEILSFIVGLLSAEEVQKGRSSFAGKIGEAVASPGWTLIDDGRLKGGLATSPVDGEGVPQQTTPLIVDGVLKTYLYDCYTARKGKTKSTGNRSRSGYQGRGGIGPTNLYVKPGETAPEALIGVLAKGFYLTTAFGIFAAIDVASGEFSFPVAGFMIEKGKTTFPVRGIGIAGNLFTLLKNVDKVGNDLTWFGSTGCPTFSVNSIKIGGA